MIFHANHLTYLHIIALGIAQVFLMKSSKLIAEKKKKTKTYDFSLLIYIFH